MHANGARNFNARQMQHHANSHSNIHSANNNSHAHGQAHNHAHAHSKQAASTSSLHKPLVSANSTPPSSAADQLTSSSGSDNNLDELHLLARAYQQQQHWNAVLGAQPPATGNNLNSSFFTPAASDLSLLHQHQQLQSAGSGVGKGGGRPAVGASSRFLLGVLFTIAQLLVYAVVGLWLFWATQHDDGFGWQADRKQQFNTHAMLMLCGFVFFNVQAMLVYRSFACCGKVYTKILHTILHILAATSIALGLVLGFAAQENIAPNAKPIMHFYSLHAWIGLSCVGLFALQFLFGFFAFLVCMCCGANNSSFRSALLPVHKTFGLSILSLAIAGCLTGLLQTARSRLTSKLNKTDYHELAEPALAINALGVCLILLAVIVPYIVRNLDFSSAQLTANLLLAQTNADKLKYAASLKAAKAVQRSLGRQTSATSKQDLNKRLKLSKLDMRHI